MKANSRNSQNIWPAKYKRFTVWISTTTLNLFSKCMQFSKWQQNILLFKVSFKVCIWQFICTHFSLTTNVLQHYWSFIIEVSSSALLCCFEKELARSENALSAAAEEWSNQSEIDFGSQCDTIVKGMQILVSLKGVGASQASQAMAWPLSYAWLTNSFLVAVASLQRIIVTSLANHLTYLS